MKRLIIPGFLAALLAAAPLAGTARAAEVHGRVSESLFLQTDDATTQTYNFLRTRLYLNALGVREGTDVHFDGQYRSKGSQDYNKNIDTTRIDQANVEMRSLMEGATLTVGRQYIDPMPGARVDGLNADFAVGQHAGAGAFAGLKPDPFRDWFTTAYSTYGLYGYLHEKGLAASVGVASSQHKGKEDELYLYSSAAWSPDDAMSLYGSMRADSKVDGNASSKLGPDITSLMLNMNYRWGWDARVNVTYSQYRAVWLQDTMSYGLDHSINRNYQVYGDHSLTRTSKVYADASYATRGSDGKSGNVLGVGYRENDIAGILYGNAAFRLVNYYSNSGWQGSFAIGADPREDVNTELSLSYLSTKQTGSTGDLTQMIYGASVNYAVSKDLYLYGMLEFSDQKIPTLDATRYKDNYKTTSVFANLDYRF